MLREACQELAAGPVAEDQVVAWYSSIVHSTHITPVTKQYALTSLTKLSTRFPASCTAAIQAAVDTFGSHVDVDLQQRGVEFGQLFRRQAAIRGQILEPMPPMERKTGLEADVTVPASTSSAALLDPGVPEPPPAEGGSTLIDLLGLGDPAEPPGGGALPQGAGLGDILGLGPAPALLDGLGGLDLGAPAPLALPTTNGGLDSLLNGVDTAAFVTPAETPSMVAYEKHGLRVVFTFPTSAATSITLLAHNLTTGPIQEFVFQVI